MWRDWRLFGAERTGTVERLIGQGGRVSTQGLGDWARVKSGPGKRQAKNKC
jgi:hypothetical protein